MNTIFRLFLLTLAASFVFMIIDHQGIVTKVIQISFFLLIAGFLLYIYDLRR